MSYVPFVENGYLSQNRRKKSIKGFKMINNSRENQTYRKGKIIIHVIRGTMTKDDHHTNFASMVSYVESTGRFKREHSKLKKIIQKYPDHHIVLSGHSLGGVLAIELGEEEQESVDEIHVFNPTSLPGDLPFNFLFSLSCLTLGIGTRCKLRKKLYVYRNVADPVSIGHLLSSTELVVSPEIHFMGGFKKEELYHLAKSRKCEVNRKSKKKDIISAIIES